MHADEKKQRQEIDRIYKIYRITVKTKRFF